ncbi:hypothetical protein [Thiomicrorhabdus aquaedulcis]|uniref:hypothetical protein n=1 Tax=Thiomicrorhabdus aquaedulcis TaxID=2211106 RepID=UPI000FDA53EA|nr:hypothetical protein [Thiomicrorhabdus aquaedulcis]
MTPQALRLHNLNEILKRFDSTTALAKVCGVTDAHIKKMRLVGYVGSRAAEKIEQALGLEKGWMDTHDQALIHPVEETQAVTASVAIPPKVLETAPSVPQKTVKDTFSFPQKDHDLIHALCDKLLLNGVRANKSEVIRAALYSLNALSNEEMIGVVQSLERVQVGRPRQTL